MTDERLTKNPLGDAGRQVRDNVKALRIRRGLTHQQLSDMLAARGRPIPVLGISRIENGARRVDVDDLVALAPLLGTTPCRILAPSADAELTAMQLERQRARMGQVLSNITAAADDEEVSPQLFLDYLTEAFRGYPEPGEVGAIVPEADDGER